MAQGVYERVQAKRKAESEGKYSGVYDRVNVRRAYLQIGDINKQLESLQPKIEQTYKSYSTRFYDENGNFVNSYRGDTKDAYDSFNSQKSSLDNDINYINSYLSKYGKYLNSDYVSSIRDYLSGSSKSLSDMRNAYQSDDKFWSQFPTESDYHGWLATDETMEYDAEGNATRKGAYDKIQTRIEELNELIKNFKSDNEGSWGWTTNADSNIPVPSYTVKAKNQSEYDALVSERDKLVAYSNNYNNINAVYAEIENYQQLPEFSNWAAQGDMMGVVDYDDAFEYHANYYNEVQKIMNNHDVGFDKNAALEALNAKEPTAVNKLATYRNFMENYYTEDFEADLQQHIEINNQNYKSEGHSNDVLDIIQEGRNNHWDAITDEEYQVYCAKLASEGEDAADEYLNKLSTIVSKREYIKDSEQNAETYNNANWLEKVFLNVASVPANIVGGAVGFLDDVGDYIDTGTINPYSNAHSLSQFATDIRYNTAADLDAATGNFEFLGQSLGDAYQAAMSGLDSLVGAYSLGGGYTYVMGMGAASSEAKRLYEQGASNEQIAAGGLLAGATEIIFEKVSIDRFLDKFVNAPTMSGRQALVQALLQGFTEASEEAATEIVNTISNAIVMGSQSDWEQAIAKYKYEGCNDSEAIARAFVDVCGNVWDAMAGGFISGGMMGGGGALINLVSNKVDQSNAIKQDGADIVGNNNVEGLLAAVRNLPNTKANAKIKALAEDMGKIDTTKLSKAEYKRFSDRVGKLYSLIQNAQVSKLSTSKSDATKSIITEKLNSLGIENESDISKATEAIFNTVYKGKKLSASESKLLDRIGATKVVNELMNESSDVNAEAIKSWDRAKGQLRETQSLTNKTDSRTIDTSSYSLSDDGKTYIKGTDEAVSITGIQSIKNGDIKVNLSNGKTESISNIDLGSQDDAVIYQGILDMGVDSATASLIVKSFENGTDATSYIYGVQDAIKYGKIGGKAYVNSGVFTSKLTDKQRSDFYRVGEMVTEREAKNKAKAIENAKKDNKVKGKVIGNVSFDGVDRNSLSERQRVAVDAIEATFSEIGINVVFFQSPVNERGEHIGENGSYDPETNTIRLDISAGLKNQDTILFTAAHELTHFIAAWSDTKFKTFADFLVKNYAKHGVSVNDLVQAKIEMSKNSKTYDKPLTYEEAFEEVVADSCESFLRDSDLVTKLTELAKKDMTLFERIKDYIDGLFDRLKKAYAGLTPDSLEANEVLAMKDCIGELRKMWVEAAMEARENFQAAGGKALKNTTDEGGVKKQARELQRKDPTKLKEEELLNLLEYTKDKVLSDDTYIPVRVNTPNILIAFAKECGYTLESHPLAMKVYKARQALSNEENWDGDFNDKPHDLSPEEIVEIIRAMNNPSYLVFQAENERFAEIVKFEKEGSKEKAYAIIDFNDESKNPDIMNGYKGGKYNILVTVYPSENTKELKDYLSNKKHKVVTGEEMKKKGLSQGSYGGNTPSLLNDSPFFEDSIPQSSKKSQEKKSDRTENTIETVNNTVFGEKQIDVGKTESGVKYQLRENAKISKAATDYNNKHMNVEATILTTGVEMMHEMAEVMLPYLEEEGILPPDIPGKTIFKNGSYGRTGENTTLCVRTLTYEDFKDRVSEKIGRPLTVSESLLVSQKIYDIATEPQCIYCYVAADRKAYDGYLGEYWTAMDKYIKALKKGGDPKALYEEYLNGRKDTAQQQKRWASWVALAKSGKAYISQKDLTTKLKRELIIAKNNEFSKQVKDAQRYAQSASWAKTVYDYRAYKGDILKMSQKFVDMLNSEYGLRMYSFSDYTPAFIVENMQMIIDAAVKGLKSLAYTKDTDYAEIFAPTGQAINVSCFAKYDLAKKTYVEDNRQGANWVKTKELRNKFNNVGAVMVCTSDEMVMWALKQDWVDVIIPYHIVKTGTTIANEYGWNNYTSESADKVNGRVANIYPTEHNNSFATYSKLVKERGITPRFSRYYAMVDRGEITRQQYMKLVNEVRLPASKLSAVKPVFNLDAAKRSFGVDKDGNVIKGGFVDKGGYMGGWYRQGVDVNQEVLAVAKDIEMGKSSLDVDYGMSKASKEKVEAKYGIKRSDRYLEGLTESDQENAQKVISNLKTRAVGSRILDGYATYTTERMEREIKNSSASGVPDYAKSYITWVNPIDFVYATTTNEEFRAKLRKEAGTLDVEKLQKETQPIHLTVDFETGEIVGHEGRHRMLALSEKGIDKVVVIIDAWNDNRYQTKPIDIMKLKGQVFDGTRHGSDFYLTDMLPLSERYADTARKLFTSKPKSNIQFSDRVTNKETLTFLNKQIKNGEFITTYKSMRLDGFDENGNPILHSPMAAEINGKFENEYELGNWYQAVEHPELIKFDKKNGLPYFELDKGVDEFGDELGKVPARYNPYEHSSNYVINDQFKTAFKRPNLVVVEMRIPLSEMSSGYQAQYAKDPVGWQEWKKGDVASALAKKGKERQVLLSRWAMPYRILTDTEVAKQYKDLLSGTGVKVPNNVVTPSLLSALEDAGVEIDYNGIERFNQQYAKKAEERAKKSKSNSNVKLQSRPTESVSNRSLLANALEGAVQNEVEKTKLAEYKNNIDRINAEEKKLSELRKQIHEMSFKPGKRDAATQEKLRKLRDEALRSTNRISLYDKKLLTLEASKPLMNVLKREKAKAVERQKTKDAETMAAYRQYQNEKFDAIKKQYQESRQKAVEGRHRTELRNKIKRVVNDLNQYLLKGTKDKHIMIGLQKSVAMALDAVNMDTVGADERVAKYNALIAKATDPDVKASLTETRDRIQQMGDRMNDKLDKLKSAYEEIKNSDDPDVANAYDEVIENAINSVIADVGETSLRDMTYTQLESVYDLYTMILTRVRGANESFKSAKNENIKIRGSRVTTEVERTGGNHPLSIKALGAVKGFAWNTLKPTYAFETIGSETLTEAFENVRSGEDTWATDVNEAKDYYKDKTDKYGFDSWDFKTRHTFKSTSGISFELSLEQIMSLYAYSKRKQAGLHLQYGGFVFDDSIEVVEKKHGVPIKYNVKTANAHNLSPETLLAIIGTLTTEQKSFVDEMQEYLSAVMGAKGNEVSLAMYGVKLFKEKFYFPLKSAKQFLFEQNQTAGEVRIKNAGFTKDVVPEAKNPVILSNFTDVWSNHVNDMAMYHSFVLALEDFNRIFNYKTPVDENIATNSVKSAIQNAYGKQANDYIKQLLTDLNGGARVDSATGFLSKTIGMFKKASVFASASVVVQQPSAIGRAFAIIDPKYFATNPGIKGHKDLWEEVKKYAPVAIIKEMGYFDTHVGKQTTDWIKAKEYKTIGEKAKALFTDSGYRDDILSKAPALADELAWSYIWQAVKKEVAATTNLKVGSEEYLQRCGKRFTEVITKTQVYDSVLARSGMMRSNDTGMKMVTAFMGEPTTSLNMLTNALIQGKRGNKRYARKAVGGVVTSMVLNSILVALVYAARDDDEDETYLEKYVSAFSGQMADSINPLTLIPWVKDIWSIVQGYDVERSDMSVISDLWNAFSDLTNENKSAYRKVEDFVGSVSSMFGLPAKNIMRDARSIYNVFDTAINGGKTTWYGIEDAIIEGVTGKDVSLMERAERAMSRGDSKTFSKTVSEMIQSKVDDGKTEKEAKSSVRSSFTSRYKKLYVEAAKKHNSAEMTRIRKLLYQTGVYGTLTELDETLKKWRTE